MRIGGNARFYGNSVIWNGNLMAECHNNLLFRDSGTGMLEVVCTKCDATVIRHQSHPVLEVTRTRVWPFYLLFFWRRK